MENFTKKLKVFFGKVKAKAVEIFKIVKEWVIAHKVPSIIIASVLAVAIILAIVLPIALGDKCKKGHAWEAGDVVPPTCTEDGYTVYTCTNKKCDATENRDVVAALGHTYADATCTAAKTCSVCQATEGEALGHTWNEGTVTTAPTCTEAGVMTYACTVEGCEGTKTEEIPAAHTWATEGTVTTAPTCTEAGVMTYACTVEGCEGAKTEEIPAAHTEEDIAAVAPTCQATGLTAGKKCSVCGTVTVAQEEVAIDADAHTFVQTEEINITADGAFYVEACACGATKNGAAAENYVVVEDAATLVIESGKTYILGETAMGAFTLTGELTNVTFIGGKFASFTVEAAIDGLTIKDAAFATEAGTYFFNKENNAIVKNVVIDGCAFDGTNLTNNAVNVHIGNGIENLTVTNCEFANMGVESICVYINVAANVGTVNIANNTADNFDQRFVRVNGVTEGTVTISGNTLTNWVNTYNDADIIKATDTTATYVVENNTLDGEAIPAEKINVPVVEETPDAGENGAGELQ